MARINIPFSDAAVLPAEQGMQTNTNALESRTNQVVNEQGRILDIAFKQADAARSTAYGAEVRAMEAEQNASLMKLFPAAMKDIGDILNQSVEKIARLDQAQFDENLVKEMNAYMLDEGFKLQEEYLNYRQGLKESNDSNAPKKMSAWMSERMQNILGKAPSERAKLAMTEKLMNMKLNALEDGFRIRDSSLAEGRRQREKSAFEALIKATRNNPQDAETNIEMLKQVGANILNNGASPEEATRMMLSGATEIVGSAVQGFIDQKKPESAIQLLAQDKVKSQIDAKAGTAMLNTAAKAALINTVTNKKEIKLGVNLALLDEGLLTKGAAGAEDAANVSFLQFRTRLAPAQDRDSAMFTHQADVAYFSNKNKILDKETAERLLDESTDVMTRNSNPYAAAASALTVTALIKNKEGNLGDLGTQLTDEASGIYKQKLGAALAMGNAINNGASIESAAELGAVLMKPVTETEKKNREEVFQTTLTAIDKEGKTTQFARDAFKSIGAPSNNKSYTSIKGAGEFIAEYTDAVKSSYIITGDLESSKAIATMQLARKYSHTEINGTSEIMRAAPDLYFKDMDKIKALKDERAVDIATRMSKSLGIMVEYNNKTGELIQKNPDGKPINAMKVGLQPIYIETEKNQKEKRYMIVNQRTGVPLTDPEDPTMIEGVSFEYDINKYNESLEAERQRRYKALGVDNIDSSSVEDIARILTPEQRRDFEFGKLKELESQLLRGK